MRAHTGIGTGVRCEVCGEGASEDVVDVYPFEL